MENHEVKFLLITPPFTQLNTPYPATAYIKGFLNTKNITSYQIDIGLEVILEIFSTEGFKNIFEYITSKNKIYSDNATRIINLRHDYIKTIEPIIHFLQNKNPNLAHLICEGNFLPQASRFSQLEDLEWAFGTMGIQDKARHLATLYLEDISDLIIEAVDPHFGFSRYAEKLGRSASTFEELKSALNNENTYIDAITLKILNEKINTYKPKIVAFTVPFPGNLYSTLKCGQFIKKKIIDIKVALGGGFANTELRSISDKNVFDYIDFITLDDGEAPILCLFQYVEKIRNIEKLKRTFVLENDNVIYKNGSEMPDFKQKDVGTPDYSNLKLNEYISVIEIVNPMHRLWSDGRWNKLTLAHGCYWGKCTFCDISLDYIKSYEFTTAKVIVDRIEQIMIQTGQTGFHFVDEAAPPALMKEVALEILKRNLTVVWWTNIRFEKSFTIDLCRLLAESGCIAVSGGLEVASDRLLELIEKGVTVAQVARVANNFTQSGIMVHAYLMYGFPTQTIQETIDSMEIVRQLFSNGVLQSGFWHQFAMTAHSPVGMFPEKFNVKKNSNVVGTFANNDIEYNDLTGCNHDLFSDGLKKSLFNYMYGIGYDLPLHRWFDFFTPKTSIKQNYIEKILLLNEDKKIQTNAKMVWIGGKVAFTTEVSQKNKTSKEMILIINKKSNVRLNFEIIYKEIIEIITEKKYNPISISMLESTYNFSKLLTEQFLESNTIKNLKGNGLIIL